MSTDIELSQRSSPEFVGGGFVTIPVGVLVFLLSRGGESRFYPVVGVLLVLVGWALLGIGLARVGAKVDDLYRIRVTRSRTTGTDDRH